MIMDRKTKDAILGDVLLAYEEAGKVFNKTTCEEARLNTWHIMLACDRAVKLLLPVSEEVERQLQEISRRCQVPTATPDAMLARFNSRAP